MVVSGNIPMVIVLSLAATVPVLVADAVGLVPHPAIKIKPPKANTLIQVRVQPMREPRFKKGNRELTPLFPPMFGG